MLFQYKVQICNCRTRERTGSLSKDGTLMLSVSFASGTWFSSVEARLPPFRSSDTVDILQEVQMRGRDSDERFRIRGF